MLLGRVKGLVLELWCGPCGEFHRVARRYRRGTAGYQDDVGEILVVRDQGTSRILDPEGTPPGKGTEQGSGAGPSSPRRGSRNLMLRRMRVAGGFQS